MNLTLKASIGSPRLCRDCFVVFNSGSRCSDCNSPRVVFHKELLNLSIAHIDCDAFYASIEKKDDPNIRNLPVIVGGQTRGVVTTCCYIARINGVRSAMPIFQAKKLCPNAIFLSPRMNYYRKVSNSIKERLKKLSPAIEFISLDEAYIDLSGTHRLHGEPPAIVLAKISKEIETTFGITISIGLSYNKFLSKIGSDLDKPRGFSIIGYSDSAAILKKQSVSKIPGVGKKTNLVLESHGIILIGDILKHSKEYLKNIVGSFGERLWFLARGVDNRIIKPNKPAKSLSCETTFQTNQVKLDVLEILLWELTEKTASRLKRLSLVPKQLQLKLKKENFEILVKSTLLKYPSNSQEIIFQASKTMLQKNISKGPFRLIGLTLSNFVTADNNNQNGNLFFESDHKTRRTDEAIDHIRSKFGKDSIVKGRSFKHIK